MEPNAARGSGGETSFGRFGVTVQPQKGTAIAWPNVDETGAAVLGQILKADWTVTVVSCEASRRDGRFIRPGMFRVTRQGAKKNTAAVWCLGYLQLSWLCVQNFCRSFPQKSDVLTGKSQRGCRVAVEGYHYWCQDFRSACCYWSHHERRWSPYQATSYHFAATINSDHDWPWLHIHLLRKLSLKVKYAMNIWVHGQKQPDNSWIKWHRWARCYGKGQSTMSHSLLDPCRQCPWALHLWPTDLLCNLCDS